LNAKRLSLGAFGEPLTLLLLALRRIATNIVAEAFDDRPPRGRLTSEAKRLDIEIGELIKDSSGFDGTITVATAPYNTQPLFDLAESAGSQLLDALDSESHGIPRNSSIQKYLRALPTGINRQTYWLHKNGKPLREVTFGEPVFPDLPVDVPYIAEYLGNIIGVGFEPGRFEVKIKPEDGGVVTLAATSDQVDSALSLRDTKARIIAVVHTNSHRLVVLQDAEKPLNRSTREAAVFEHWSGALARLAK
jgi:hypothetical protein